MKNKVLVKLIVPEIDEEFDIFIPINKRIGNIIILIIKSILELKQVNYNLNPASSLYNRETGERYSEQSLVRETNIRNGTNLILM